MSENLNARGALDTVFNIAKAWGLSEDEEAAILGQPDREALRAWKEESGPEIGEETKLRMSYVLGIFRAINTLLPIPERADAWMRKPNKAPIFGGRNTKNDRYDYQSVVGHELGHAFGLGHGEGVSPSLPCQLYYSFSKGQDRRALCAGEINQFRNLYNYDINPRTPR